MRVAVDSSTALRAGPPPAPAAAGAAGAGERRGRRRLRLWLAVSLGGMGLLMALAGLLLVSSLAETDEGRGGGLADRIEQVIRRDETLHYRVHLTMGKLLSLCPCTRGRSAEEYRKASFHAPEDVRQRRALLAKLPGAATQVDALVTCQRHLQDRLRAAGAAATFTPLRDMTQEELDLVIFDNGSGVFNAVQQVAIHRQDEANPVVPQSEVIYTCDVRRLPVGQWMVVSLAVLD